MSDSDEPYFPRHANPGPLIKLEPAHAPNLEDEADAEIDRLRASHDGLVGELARATARLEASEAAREEQGEAYTALYARLDASERAAAAMRDALERLLKVPGVSPGPRGYEMVSSRARATLASDAGRDFVSRADVEKLQAFKEYIHRRLDAAGVPADPEPEASAAHGCRIEGRLDFVLSLAMAAAFDCGRSQGVK